MARNEDGSAASIGVPASAAGSPHSSQPHIGADSVAAPVAPAPSTSGNKREEPKNITRELARRIDGSEVASCEVLGIDEDEVLTGRWRSDDEVREQLARFHTRLGHLEKNPAIKALRQELRNYASWLGAIAAIKSADALTAFVRGERRRSALDDLENAARVYLSDDGSIDHNEHQKLLRRAAALGLSPEDVAKVCEGLLGKPLSIAPPAPVARGGWKPLAALASGSRESWRLPDLQEAILSNFDQAIALLLQDENRNDSLVGYLANRDGKDADDAHTAALAARRWLMSEEVEEKGAGVWQFLWLTGRPTLHLVRKQRPTAQGSRQIETLDRLFEYAMSEPGGLDVIGYTLTCGVLERWLDIVAKVPAAARVARELRIAARRAPASSSGERERASALTALWAAGLRVLPLLSDDRGSVAAITSSSELVKRVEEGGSRQFFAWLLRTGLLATWLGMVEPQRAASARAAAELKLAAAETWLYQNGATLLPLGVAQASVSSLPSLLEITDSGQAVLAEELLTSGVVEAWAEHALRDRKLADAARGFRLDAYGSKAERLRQYAGAKSFRIAGTEASTPEAFAQLALAAREGAELSLEQIDAALQARLPQARFSRLHAALSTQLDEIAARSIPPAHRALLACIASGLDRLPLAPQGGARVVLASLLDIETGLHERGFRAALIAVLGSGVLRAWVERVLPRVPEELQRALEREAGVVRSSASDARKLAAADAIARAGVGRGTCHLAASVAPKTFAELQAVALDARVFSFFSDPEARERIREACGAYGGPAIAGCPGPGKLTEERLAQLPLAFAAHAFIWDWLRVPLLRFSSDIAVNSHAQLLELLGKPAGIAGAAAAAQSGLLVAWARLFLDRELPDELLNARGVPPESFVRFALWLGDKPPKLDVSLNKSTLVVPEGGHSSVAIAITNTDSVRPAEVMLVVPGVAGLELSVEEPSLTPTERRTYFIGPGQTFTAKLELRSLPGHSGANTVRVQALLPVTSQQAVLAAEASLTCDVRFQRALLARYALLGLAAGAVLFAGYRSVLPLVLAWSARAGSDADIIAAADIRTAAERTLGLLALGVLALAQRVWLALKHRALPTLDNTKIAFSLALLSALVLTPAGGVVGCMVGGCSEGMTMEGGCKSYGIGSFVIGLSFGTFLLLRPGAIFLGLQGLLHDIVFGALVFAGLVFAPSIGDGVLSIVDSLDTTFLGVASSFGLGDAHGGTTTFVRGAALFGGLAGLAMGVKRGLTMMNRGRLGWAQLAGCAGVIAATGTLGFDPRSSAAVAEPALASTEQCASAVENAGVLLAATRGREPGGVLPESFAQELEQAVALCTAAKTQASHTACLSAASSVAELVQCGPFWLQEVAP